MPLWFHLRACAAPQWFALGFCVIVLLLALVGFWKMSQPIWGGNESGLRVAAVAPARLESHVRMLSETLSPRDHDHPDNLDRVANYIRSEFSRTKASVSEQPFSVAGNQYRNVIARFGPAEGPRIVVGAHYDSAGPLPAADDNASGVAGLIELALLVDRKLPSITVELVAFTLEEPPYFRTQQMGSAVHARALKEQRIEVLAMLLIEMIGTFSDQEDSQQFPISLMRLFYPSVGNFIAVIGKIGQGSLTRRVKKAMRGASMVPVYSINGLRFIPGIDFSDHSCYWDVGYPAVMITDTAFYRNFHYHTEKDTADRLDYTKMAEVVRGIYAAVLDLGS